MISVIIPARNEPYVQKTIDSLLFNALGDIEIIVVLDGYWPNPIIKDDPRVILIHNSISKGMRHSINSAISIARGKFIMKSDAHCLFMKGFDTVFSNDCQENWMLVPSRYSLDVEKWERYKPEQRLAVEYDYITFPYLNDDQFGTGIHGKKWMTREDRGFSSYYGLELQKKDIKIDDIIAFQGSCWFMPRELFLKIDCLDEVHSFNIHQEAQELVFKVWLSGGRVAIDKNVWYAHWHKDTERGFMLSKEAMKDTERFSTDYWMNDKWPKRIRSIKWLINKFMPMPNWPEDWADKIKSETNFRVFDPRGWNGMP